MRTIVYTAILGGCDSLKPAPVGADRAVCFVDRADGWPDCGWELVSHGGFTDPRREAWRLRCVPHELFADYDRVVWVDASFTLTNLPRLLKDAGRQSIAALRHHDRRSWHQEGRRLVKIGQAEAGDIHGQLEAYKDAGFTCPHLSISCIVVRDRSQDAQHFNETWASEIQKWPGDNTQVSLDYSAWKHRLTIKALRGTRHDNPYAVHDRRDHERRRQPYRRAA